MDSGQKERIRKILEQDKRTIREMREFLGVNSQAAKMRKYLMQAEFSLLVAIDEIKNIGKKEDPQEEKQDGEEKVLSHTDKNE